MQGKTTQSLYRVLQENLQYFGRKPPKLNYIKNYIAKLPVGYLKLNNYGHNDQISLKNQKSYRVIHYYILIKT